MIKTKVLALVERPYTDYDTSTAISGFNQLQAELVFVPRHEAYQFHNRQIMKSNSKNDVDEVLDFYRQFDCIVTDVRLLKAIWDFMGVRHIPMAPFPTKLNSPEFLGRKILRMSLGEALYLPKKTADVYFVKPQNPKAWTTIQVGPQNHEDLMMAHMHRISDLCFVSRTLPVISEWRCFVHQHQVQDIRSYSGDRLTHDELDLPKITRMAEALPYGTAVMDVGICAGDPPQTYLIEVNDAYAFGSYGLDPVVYAQMLLANYGQILGGRDAKK